MKKYLITLLALIVIGVLLCLQCFNSSVNSYNSMEHALVSLKGDISKLNGLQICLVETTGFPNLLSSSLTIEDNKLIVNNSYKQISTHEEFMQLYHDEIREFGVIDNQALYDLQNEIKKDIDWEDKSIYYSYVMLKSYLEYYPIMFEYNSNMMRYFNTNQQAYKKINELFKIPVLNEKYGLDFRNKSVEYSGLDAAYGPVVYCDTAKYDNSIYFTLLKNNEKVDFSHLALGYGLYVMPVNYNGDPVVDEIRNVLTINENDKIVGIEITQDEIILAVQRDSALFLEVYAKNNMSLQTKESLEPMEWPSELKLKDDNLFVYDSKGNFIFFNKASGKYEKVSSGNFVEQSDKWAMIQIDKLDFSFKDGKLAIVIPWLWDLNSETVLALFIYEGDDCTCMAKLADYKEKSGVESSYLTYQKLWLVNIDEFQYLSN